MLSDSLANALTRVGDFSAVDAIVSDYFDRGGQPAIAYGIVSGGRLVHSAGFGERVPGAGPPNADTVFRIASMSKSFTASAVLLLRDAGSLALDDPAATYVPELAGWTYGCADAAPVTIRQLLTMTAGLPTDDPWGDRQQGLPIQAFDELLARGVSFNWAPDTRFEYSNLGYAILGRVVTLASGVLYDEFIRTRLLAPLQLDRTGFEPGEFQGDNLAVGYRRGLRGWEEVPFDPYGAFASMGGLFSSVSDIARWVAGFAAAFPPDGSRAGNAAGDAAGDGDTPHPLRPASRRQMQLPQAVTAWRSPDRLPGGPPAPPAYYGFGLFADEDPALGRIISHSGGYPGFGTNMRWHPATGVGVIALANGTYAPVTALTSLVLDALLPRSSAYHVAIAPAAPASPAAPAVSAGAPWPETLAAAEAVNRLLLAWDDSAADALFTENVALDGPYPERRHAIGQIRERIGDFTADGPAGTPAGTPGAAGARPDESDTPAHRRWWLTGPHGTVQAQIQLNPERPPRVQSLAIAVPPARDSVLAAAIGTVIEWLNNGDAPWPAALPVAASADATLIARRLRMAAVWAGKCAAGAYQAGNGSTAAAVELVGEHATVTLSLLVNPATGELRQADIAL